MQWRISIELVDPETHEPSTVIAQMLSFRHHLKYIEF